MLLATLSISACDREQDESPGAVHEPTFNRHIAPIIFQNCSPCHRPGEAGPFPLLTYRDASKRAYQIADVTSRRYMPPWKPEPGYGEFVGVRRLSDAQIAMIQRWGDGGAVEGDAADLPALPEWEKGWQLGEPDLIVGMTEPFTLPAEGGDVYRNFVIPLDVSGTRYIKAVELRPENPRIVHHAEMVFDLFGAARKRDAADPEPGFEGMRWGEIQKPDGQYLGWTPGTTPFSVDDSLAFTVHSGTDLVLLLHMFPSGKPEPVEVKAGFWFSHEPPTRTPTLLRLSRKDIDIPAGDSNHVIADSTRLPVDVHVLAVYPHAHYLGKSIEGFARLPDGGLEWLIRIPDWDFDWQNQYRYVEPVFLPEGSTVVMRTVYDNSSANVRNPNDPPKRVRYGVNSSDEMGDLVLQFLPAREGDLPSLQRSFARKWLLQEIDAARTLLSVDPDDAEKHNALGWYYLTGGAIERALPAFESALRLQPDYVDAHVNLAVALARKGRFEKAEKHLHRALAFHPANPEAHFNLGGIHSRFGRIDSAVHHFEIAANLRPDRAQEVEESIAKLTASSGDR